MPTTLEWLAKRQGLSLFWGTSIYIIGLVTAFSTWWLKRE
jgi:branched-subunit amino acid transport protein AzlD